MQPICLPPTLTDLFEEAWRVVVPKIAPDTHVLLPDHRASFTFIGGYPFGPNTVLFSGPSRQARIVPMIPGQVYAGVAIRPGAAIALGLDPIQNHLPLTLPSLAMGLERAAECGRTAELEHALQMLKADARAVDPVVAAMVANIRQDAHQVPARSSGTRLSERQCRRRFVRAVGLSPKAFEATLRLRNAMIDGIIMPATSVASIASAHGYADQPHFGRAVHEAFQAPPREVRKSLQQTRERFLNSTR